MKGKRDLLIIILGLIVLGLIIGLVWYSQTHRTEKRNEVSIRLSWLHQASFAGLYVAQKEGYFKDLDVTFQPGGMDAPAIQTVASGSDQFGLIDASQVLVARGKGIPVVAVAIIFQKNPFVLFSLKDSGIDSLEKAQGKKMGVKYATDGDAIYRSMLKNANLDAKNFKEVPVQYDVTPLLTGQIDLYPGMIFNEPITVEEKGYSINLIRPESYGVNLYGSALFTTESMIRDKPEVVRQVVQAAIKGWQKALKDPELAVRYTLEQSDKLKKEHETKMLKICLDLIKNDDKPIGSMEKNSWLAMQDFLIKEGTMKEKVELDKAFTIQFLPI
jgi:ABC-type nitrate/sulfonate/bicarbonate transport system substrate-binding protein